MEPRRQPPLRTLWHVTVPLIRAGLIAAFLFAFITSFDELTIALFVTGGLATTLPKQMWDEALFKVTPHAGGGLRPPAGLRDGDDPAR